MLCCLEGCLCVHVPLFSFCPILLPVFSSTRYFCFATQLCVLIVGQPHYMLHSQATTKCAKNHPANQSNQKKLQRHPSHAALLWSPPAPTLPRALTSALLHAALAFSNAVRSSGPAALRPDLRAIRCCCTNAFSCNSVSCWQGVKWLR